MPLPSYAPSRTSARSDRPASAATACRLASSTRAGRKAPHVPTLISVIRAAGASGSGVVEGSTKLSPSGAAHLTAPASRRRCSTARSLPRELPSLIPAAVSSRGVGTLAARRSWGEPAVASGQPSSMNRYPANLPDRNSAMRSRQPTSMYLDRHPVLTPPRWAGRPPLAGQRPFPPRARRSSPRRFRWVPGTGRTTRWCAKPRARGCFGRRWAVVRRRNESVEMGAGGFEPP